MTVLHYYRCFECGNTIKTRNGVMFNFYPRLILLQREFGKMRLYYIEQVLGNSEQ